MDLESIRKELVKTISPKRYEHTLSVAYTAANLACVNQIDPGDSIIAGMLHDCAKGMSPEQLIAYCEKHDIEISDVERRNPGGLLHAKVGADLAKEKYGISNLEILDAIRFHTTGRPGMTTLDKILYISDYIEPYRNHTPNLSFIRQMAFMDLERTLIKILKDSLAYLNATDTPIDEMTRLTYEYYTVKD